MVEGLLKQITDLVEERKEEIIALLKEIIKIPSVSGEEAEIANVLANKMRSIGFDIVRVDRLNDVIGTLKGTGGGRSLLFNGHIDHVPPGDMLDPYSGKLMDGANFDVEGDVIYGRGASDMKGAVAAMVMAGAVLKELNLTLKGDLYVVGVAEEERGGAGTKTTITEGHVLADIVLIGEATNMELALGHRGGAGTSVVVRGRSCHASAPERGINALYKAMSMIKRIREELIPRLPDDPIFGKTTLAVTKIRVKPDVGNVVPEECEFYIDCRNSPRFPVSALKQALENIVEVLKSEDEDFDALVLPKTIITEGKEFRGFYTDPKKYNIVYDIKDVIKEVLGREPKLTTWRFTTDGRIYAGLGIPVIGFGPGDEKFAHTHKDHVRVRDFLDSVKVYAYLAWRLCN